MSAAVPMHLHVSYPKPVVNDHAPCCDEPLGLVSTRVAQKPSSVVANDPLPNGSTRSGGLKGLWPSWRACVATGAPVAESTCTRWLWDSATQIAPEPATATPRVDELAGCAAVGARLR